jgi:hypothetical protein
MAIHCVVSPAMKTAMAWSRFNQVRDLIWGFNNIGNAEGDPNDL